MNQCEHETNRRRSGNVIWGVVLIGLGILFLLMNLDILPDMEDMWPAILIIVGLALAVGAFVKKDKPAVSRPHGDYPGQQ
ncbi:MAG: hypothetical protein JW763_08240 [candidate division Zixibacteria bacterium]|nr:hypothetical protein [candidate division Zixibacteria bacterium]